jgi:hypothetical protein
MTTYLKFLNKLFARILKRPKQVTLLVFFLAFSINLLASSAIIDDFKISYNSLFSGMLALIGFVFAARTFITFKLYETVYSTQRYQKRIFGLKSDGTYNEKLMHPLSTLDTSLSFTTTISVVAMLLLTVISFIEPPKTSSIKNISEIFTYVSVNYKSITFELIKSKSFPVAYKLFSDIVCSTFIVVFIQLVYNLRSLNKNVGSIIDIWQEQADEDESKINNK